VLELIETISELRNRLKRSTKVESDQGSTKVEPYDSTPPANLTIGLVPTMGALHAGHAALIDTARAECDIVVVSVFVNPLQFNDDDDLARYPRTLDDDVTLCRRLGVDIVFAPSASDMYPSPPECSVDIGRLGDHLCGKFRPGHFRGVATVVLKLLEIVRPHRAYFGEKDAQQLAIIRRLITDFNVPTEVIEVPTVREADGLAMSSRNRHLTRDQRRIATCLYASLLDAKRMVEGGERSAHAIRAAAAARIPHGDIKLEYLDLVDPATLQPVDEITGPVRIAGALWVGKTRLIDNLLVRC
jgi:pantoate--beta-alanine ligase